MNGVNSSLMPRLLVSVRSAQEADAALAGGCDILDVKDPSRGPLGMASRQVIESVADVAARAGVPCSAACGEATDFPPRLTDQHDDGCIAHGHLEFFKLGPARLNSELCWQNRWKSAWLAAGKAFQLEGARRRPARPCAVAVVYADWKQAEAPSPDEILDAVVEFQAETDGSNGDVPQFAGVLIDTFDKASGGLLDCLSIEELEAFAARVRSLTSARPDCEFPANPATVLTGGHGLFLALAGRLSSRDLGHLVSVQPDVIAIRSAACRNNDRRSTVDADVTREFHRHIQDVFRNAAQGASDLVSVETA